MLKQLSPYLGIKNNLLMFVFSTTERSEVVLFLEKRTAAQVGSHQFAGFAKESCLIFWSFVMKLAGSGLWAYTQGFYTFFLEFGHQGAKLLSAKGEKMGVLTIFGGFSS